MGLKRDVVLIVGIVGFAKLTKIARRIEFDWNLESRATSLENRFFLGILNLFLKFKSFEA